MKKEGTAFFKSVKDKVFFLSSQILDVQFAECFFCIKPQKCGHKLVYYIKLDEKYTGILISQGDFSEVAPWKKRL